MTDDPPRLYRIGAGSDGYATVLPCYVRRAPITSICVVSDTPDGPVTEAAAADVFFTERAAARELDRRVRHAAELTWWGDRR